MLAKLKARTSPSLVVSIIAVVVACAGTAAAAGTLITRGSQIKDGIITSSDIKNGTIGRADLSSTLRADLGVSGSSGTSTNTGSAGPKGDPGARGDIGPTGPAGPAGPQGTQGPAGAAAPALSVGLSNIPDVAMTINFAGWDTIGGLTQTISVPTGPPMRLLATVSGESTCTGVNGYCQLRILVDGTELLPATGNEFAIGTSNSNDLSRAASVQRYSNNLSAGSHTVTVQHGVSVDGITHKLDDAVLSTMLVAGTS